LFISAFLLIAVHSVNYAGGNDKPDKKFIKKASIGGMMEVELGKYAQENAASQSVKDFGKLMETDHSKANEELKAVAEKNNFTVPDKMDDKHLDKVKKLKTRKGVDFDKEYMDMMVDDHQKDIDEFQNALNNVKNPELKDWISRTLPTLKNHLADAKKVNQQLASK
jgi:putative membrane protein